MPDLFQLPQVTPLNMGAVMPGAKLYFYRTNTSTPQNTYQDAALSTPHENPVVADADGVFAPIFLDPNLPDYRVTLKTSANATVSGYPVDDIPSLSSGGSTNVRYAVASGTANAISVTLTEPDVIAYAPGLLIELSITATITSSSVTVNVNGIGARSLVHPDGSSLVPGEIISGETILIAYQDGTSSFHLLSVTGSLTAIDGDVSNPPIRFLTAQTTGVFLGTDDLPHIAHAAADKGALFGWSEGTFTATLTGMTSTTTFTATYKKTNKLVVLMAKVIGTFGTSNTTSMGMTGIPAAIQPAYITDCPCNILDNGNIVPGIARVGTAGSITFLKWNGTTFSETAFTAASDKGLTNYWLITYDLS